MLISVSDLKLHATCPMKFNYQYRLRRGTEDRADALEIGILAHAVLEAKLGRGNWEERLAVPMPALKDWPAVAEILRVWEAPEDWKIVAVEKELRLPLGSDTLVGRLDSIVEWNGAYWHLQHKTLAGSKPVELYAETQRTDWHECVYQAMAVAEGYTPFAGTMLNVIRKLSLGTVKANPSAYYRVMAITRSEQIVFDALADIGQRLKDIEAESRGDRRIEKIRGACGGMFGNSLCHYKAVCDGAAQIDEPPFVQIEPRYTELEEAA